MGTSRSSCSRCDAESETGEVISEKCSSVGPTEGANTGGNGGLQGDDDGRACCEMGNSEIVPEKRQLESEKSDEEQEQGNNHAKKQKLCATNNRNILPRSGSIRMRIAVLRVQAKVANNMQKFSDKVEDSLQGTHASVRFYAGVRSSVFQIQSKVTKIMAEFSDEVDAILKEIDGNAIAHVFFERLSSASSRAQTETDKAMQEGLDMFDDVAQVEEAAAFNRPPPP